MNTGAITRGEEFVDEQHQARLCAQRARERLIRDSSDECAHTISAVDGRCIHCGEKVESVLTIAEARERLSGQESGHCVRIDQNPKDIAGGRKPPLDLIPPVAEIEMAMALKHGAFGPSNYGPWNWRQKKIGVSKYIAAMKRHIAQFASTEDNDGESGVHHLGHVMATAAILLDAIAHDCVNDDRVPSNIVELMREYTLPQQGDEVE